MNPTCQNLRDSSSATNFHYDINDAICSICIALDMLSSYNAVVFGGLLPRARKTALQTGELHTGDIQVLTDFWDGPRFRLSSCGVNDFRSTALFGARFRENAASELFRSG